MIARQFIAYIQEASRSPEPVSVKLSRPVQIYNNFDQTWITRENYIHFINKAYENKNGGFDG